MIMIEPISAFSDNYIWLIKETSGPLSIVVDPGDATPVLQTLQHQHLQLDAILITHHHFDHTGGIETLKEAFPNIPVYGPDSSPCDSITHRQRNNDTLSLLNNTLNLSVLEIPGHTLDHIAYYNDQWLFCGDTLFSAGCGRVFEGTMEQMHQSLHRLCQLNDHTAIYCGHEYTAANLAFASTVEPNNADIQAAIQLTQQKRSQNQPSLPSTIKREKRINPFLRTTQASVISAAQNQSGRVLSHPVEVFAELRLWKDQF